MKTMLRLLCAAAAVCAATPASGDAIILKDGRKIEGKIVQKRPSFVEIDPGGPSVLYLCEEIKRIEWSDPKNPMKERDSAIQGTGDYWLRTLEWGKPVPKLEIKVETPKAEPVKKEPAEPELPKVLPKETSKEPASDKPQRFPPQPYADDRWEE